GDPTGLNTFLDTVGRRLIPANAGQLWAERNSFLQAYWGFFGGVNVPLPDWAYIVFNIIGGVALLGGLLYLVVTLATRQRDLKWWLAALVPLLWMAVTFVSYLRWTAITPASQGRLTFVALSSTSVWMAVGLLWLTRWAGRPILAGGAIGYFAAVAVASPFLVIRPMYTAPPAPDIAGDVMVTYTPQAALGAVSLTAAGVDDTPIRPGDYVNLRVDWQLDETFDRNWSLFVHLATPDGVIIAQRDVYPGQGLLATTTITEGRRWTNPISVAVPRGAYAPNTLDVLIGWYDLNSGERLITSNGGERINIGSVQLLPRESDTNLPNPISVNFDDQIELVGYEYSTLAPQQNEEMTVTLYWRALKPIENNYVIFVHIIDASTFTIVGGSDAQPVAWTRPTSTWEVGEIVEDAHTFTVNGDAPPIPYELEIGMYTVEEDGSFPRLRVIDAFGGMADNYFYLSRVVVLPMPETDQDD
ncbi:MAG: hypothetical protein AAF125_22225, partial [Chloroflexota bacterium]